MAFMDEWPGPAFDRSSRARRGFACIRVRAVSIVPAGSGQDQENQNDDRGYEADQEKKTSRSKSCHRAA